MRVGLRLVDLLIIVSFDLCFSYISMGILTKNGTHIVFPLLLTPVQNLFFEQGTKDRTKNVYVSDTVNFNEGTSVRRTDYKHSNDLHLTFELCKELIKNVVSGRHQKQCTNCYNTSFINFPSHRIYSLFLFFVPLSNKQIFVMLSLRDIEKLYKLNGKGKYFHKVVETL